MSQPLPTDHQVVRAIRDRKAEFINMSKEKKLYEQPHLMYFHHICTVLDHAEKLFNQSPEDWLSIDFSNEKVFNSAVEER